MAEEKEATLVEWLVARYPEMRRVGDDPATRPGIVHRLDKETSGVVLAARNQKYFEYLKSLFAKRDVKKTYLALVYGRVEPRENVLSFPIGIKNGTTKRSTFSNKRAKEAFTAYRVLKYIPNGDEEDKERTAFTLLEVMPKTGRTHQIRVHLARIGHPIVGDSLYAKKKSDSRLMLHALSIEFSAEDGKRIRLEAESPEEFAQYLRNA